MEMPSGDGDGIEDDGFAAGGVCARGGLAGEAVDMHIGTG